VPTAVLDYSESPDLPAQVPGRVASYLSHELEIGGRRETALSIAGIAGYSIAVLLALGWIICILVWDSFRQGRR
jgi:hypothetical protein